MRIIFTQFKSPVGTEDFVEGRLHRSYDAVQDILTVEVDSDSATEDRLATLVAVGAELLPQGSPGQLLPDCALELRRRPRTILDSSGTEVMIPDSTLETARKIERSSTPILREIKNAYLAHPDKHALPIEYDLHIPDWRLAPVPTRVRKH